MTVFYEYFILQLNTVKDCRSHQIKRLYNTSLRLFFNTPVLADVIFKIQGTVPLPPLTRAPLSLRLWSSLQESGKWSDRIFCCIRTKTMYTLGYHCGKQVFCLELTLVPMDALQQHPPSRWFVRAEPLRMPSAHRRRLRASLVLTRPSEAWQGRGCAAGKAHAVARHRG